MNETIETVAQKRLTDLVCLVLTAILLTSCVQNTSRETQPPVSGKPETFATLDAEVSDPQVPTPTCTSTPIATLLPVPIISLELLAQLPDSITITTPVESPGILWSPTGTTEIWLLDPETGDNTLVVTANDSIGELKWAPDRKHFVFQTTLLQVWIVNIETGEQTRLENRDYKTLLRLQWIGPKLIHYCAWDDAKPGAVQYRDPCFLYNIQTQETMEGVPIPVWSDRNNPASWGSLAIAPDYRHMAFLLEGDSNYYIANLVTGEVRSVFHAPLEIPHSGFVYGHWSPDGQQFTFFVTRCCVDPGPLESKLYIVDADGSGLRQILDLNTAFSIKHSVQPTGLMWSIDGQYLSFDYSADFESSPRTLRVMRITGESLLDLGVPITLSPGPLWAPDGKRIAFISETVTDAGGDSYDLYAVDVMTGEVTRLTYDGRSKYHFDW